MDGNVHVSRHPLMLHRLALLRQRCARCRTGDGSLLLRLGMNSSLGRWDQVLRPCAMFRTLARGLYVQMLRWPALPCNGITSAGASI